MTEKYENKYSLSKLIAIGVSDCRLANWLNFVIKPIYANMGVFPELINSKTKIEAFNIISSNNVLRADLAQRASGDLINDSHLRWISFDERMLKWILRHMEVSANFQIQYDFSTLSLARDYIASMIDSWRVALKYKEDFVLKMKNEWEGYINLDGITNWIKDKPEADICEIAWACICKDIDKKFMPQSKIGRIPDLLDFLDCVRYGYVSTGQINNALAERIIAKIKNRWNQKNYRDKNNGKKQCNLLLSSQGLARLEKLAKKHNISKSNIVDILLFMEEKEKAYINKRLLVVEHAVSDLLETAPMDNLQRRPQETESTSLLSQKTIDRHQVENTTHQQEVTPDLGNTADELLM